MLKSKIGQILWVARQSRPDIMCDISILASNSKHTTVQTLHCANKLIRKLKSEEVTLRFLYLGKDSSVKLVVYSDSSMGNLPDGGTQGRHFIMLMGENGKFSPISWQSKRIRKAVRSTLAGETLALADGNDSAFFFSFYIYVYIFFFFIFLLLCKQTYYLQVTNQIQNNQGQ